MPAKKARLSLLFCHFFFLQLSSFWQTRVVPDVRDSYAAAIVSAHCAPNSKLSHSLINSCSVSLRRLISTGLDR